MTDHKTLREMIEGDISDWCTLAPRYRTKRRLIEMIDATVGNATVICGSCGVTLVEPDHPALNGAQR